MLTSSRIPLGRAHLLAAAVLREAQRAGLPAHALYPLGGLRRYAPDIGDVAVLGVAPATALVDLLDGFTRLPGVVHVAARSAWHATVLTERGEITMHVTVPEQAGAALAWHTGSRRHTELLRARAKRLGLTFKGARLLRGATDVATPDEEAFYRELALPLIAPELREGDDELAAAERGALPALVDGRDIRGDLHMHTIWSDGRDTVEGMVEAARQLGYEYIAITDHSERSAASRNLRADDIARQREEIAGVRARASDLTILHGVEVDIMPDGSLDFDDEALTGFDIVLASLHDHAGHGGKRLTERYLRAIQHPLVTVITHPANRSPGRYAGYDVDFDRVFAAAAATGTAMEIDGAPGHLDMDGALARRAAAAGVTIVIDSDCHRAEALARQMRFGVGTARRGWIEARHVLNARPVAAVQAFVAAKRTRG